MLVLCAAGLNELCLISNKLSDQGKQVIRDAWGDRGGKLGLEIADLEPFLSPLASKCGKTVNTLVTTSSLFCQSKSLDDSYSDGFATLISSNRTHSFALFFLSD